MPQSFSRFFFFVGVFSFHELVHVRERVHVNIIVLVSFFSTYPSGIVVERILMIGHGVDN
jgi:hypothetical protein